MTEASRHDETESTQAIEATRSIAEIRTHKDGEPALARGATLGRYLIVDRLGAGGMSVVYAAYDPELDRKIAVKVLRTSYWNQHGRGRALREAQAMAKLAHPNIVSIYDVGQLGDQLFIAMELVDGETLGEWIKRTAPSWREIVAVMVQAGRGLAAAHHAKLIHRDIKASNIMIDRAGRVRVMDFGVARPADAELADDPLLDGAPPVATPPAAVANPSSTGGRLEPLTVAGTVVGTPSYMAPEQRDGTADARADQYSFCVTLYEALCGTRPTDPMLDSKSWTLRKAGADPPDQPRVIRNPRVPSWIRRALQRGLQADRTLRYPTMEGLLAALTSDPAVRRRRVAVAAAVVALAGTTVAVAATGSRDAAQPCRGADDLLSGVWNPEVKRQIKRQFATSPRPYALATWDRVEKVLDDRGVRWVRMRTETCEATRVRGDQSERMLDLRMRCLDHRLGDLRALTGVFGSQIDGDVIDHAVQAALGLPPLARCADGDALSAAVAPPENPGVRAGVEALRTRLEEVTSLEHAGKHRGALALAGELAADARTLGYEPIRGEALTRLGTVQTITGNAAAAEANFAEAMAIAARTHDDLLLAESATQLMYTMGYMQARHAEALALGRVIDAIVVRAGSDHEIRAAALNVRGITLWSASRYDEARAAFEALVVMEREPGASELRLASALNSLGLVLKDQSRYPEADAALAQARQIWERVLGPEHPDVGRTLNNQGELLISQGKHAEARQQYERALGIFERAFGEQHTFVEIVANNLGELDNLENAFDAAEARCRRAADIGRSMRLGPNHPFFAYHAVCRAKALLGLHRPVEALDEATRALDIARAAAVDPADIAEMRFAHARALWDAGRDRPRSRTIVREARDVLVKAGSRKQQELAKLDRWLLEHP